MPEEQSVVHIKIVTDQISVLATWIVRSNNRFGYGRSLTPPLQHLIFSHNLDFGMDDQSNKDSLFRLVPVTSIIVLELFQAGLTNSDNSRELFPTLRHRR